MASRPNWGNSFAAFIIAPSTQVRVSMPKQASLRKPHDEYYLFQPRLTLQCVHITAAAPFFRTLCIYVFVESASTPGQESAVEHWRNRLRDGYFQPRTREA
jgi:hypothetical protein